MKEHGPTVIREEGSIAQSSRIRSRRAKISHYTGNQVYIYFSKEIINHGKRLFHEGVYFYKRICMVEFTSFQLAYL